MKLDRNIWLISDTHFFHEKILTFTDGATGELIRGSRFANVTEMNECMADNWVSTVKKDDIIYHLGDVMIGPKEEFLTLFNKLPGRKRLILGNHDDAKFLVQNNVFQKVLMWRMFPEMGLLLSHVPLHESSLRHGNPHDPNVKTMLNVHGHIHQNLSPTINHRNVSVEAINYTPINIEEIRIK